MSAARLLAALVPLLLMCGCARAPQAAGRGARLIVTMRFAGPVNDNFQYFFLIRNANDEVGQNGPVPVIEPPYANGFATASNPASPTAAFTDFVEYSFRQASVNSTGYTVYHLPGGIEGNPNTGIFQSRGQPDAAQRPTGATTLQFELGLDRLTPNAGETDPNAGQPPRFLQVNIVATTTTPRNPTTVDPDKFVDAFGEQRLGSGSFNTFLTIDAATARTYVSSDIPGDPVFEPDNDTYPRPSDPGVELVAWSIQVIPR